MLFYRGNMNIYILHDNGNLEVLDFARGAIVRNDLSGETWHRIPRAQWRQLKREQKEAKAKRKAEAEELLSHYQVMTVPEFLGLKK